MDLYEAIQAQALAAILDPADEDWLRHVFRVYSKKFATPLHQVPDLPLDDVLLAYFEETFEELDDDGREHMRQLLTETPEERTKRLEQEAKAETSDDTFFEQLNSEVKEAMEHRPKTPRALGRDETVPKPKGMDKLAEMVRKTKEKVAKRAGAELPKPIPRRPAPAKPAQQQNADPLEISMDFGESNLGFGDLSVDPLAPPPKRKQ